MVESLLPTIKYLGLLNFVVIGDYSDSMVGIGVPPPSLILTV